MDEATKELLKSGVLGAIIVILLTAIVFLGRYIVTLHKESATRQETASEQMAELAREGHIAIRNNTDIVSSVKTLLETTREKKR